MRNALLLSFLLLFSACNLASNGKEYRSMSIEEDDEIYLYSCEENFSDVNITIRLEQAHEYLFTAIHDESEKLVDKIFDDVLENNDTSKTEPSVFDWWKYLKMSYAFQSNIQTKAKEIDEKFGCVFIDSETIE